MSLLITNKVDTIDRAKEMYGDKYVKGVLDPYRKCILQEACGSQTIEGKEHYTYFSIHIDPSTRAIHFTNSGMNDSEGTPIFASLSSDGNGGDRVIKSGLGYHKEIYEIGVAVLINGSIYLMYSHNDKELLTNIKFNTEVIKGN